MLGIRRFKALLNHHAREERFLGQAVDLSFKYVPFLGSEMLEFGGAHCGSIAHRMMDAKSVAESRRSQKRVIQE